YIRGFDKYDTFIERFIRNFSLERGAVLSIALMGLSMLFFGIILFKWLASGFGPLAETRNAITAVTLFVLGFQYLTFSFFISMLLMDYDKKDD
ncbi:MAG: glycosyltransferase family 2 protein, partial [Candidatus Omnitrophota bacterium]